MGCKIQALDSGTWLIEEEADCNVYLYLLAGTERAVLLDTGYGTLPLDELTASLTPLPVTVLCTHGHYDHIGGNGFFSHVRMHRADRELYLQQQLEARRLVPNLCAPEAPAEPDWFDGALTLDLGNRTLEVFPTPGHTRGCVSVLDVERRQLFTGDTCCKGVVLLNFDHSAGLPTYRRSVASILETRPRWDRTWPSHHEKPVGAEIPTQFLEACDLLLSGRARGAEVPTSFGPAKEFFYQDISVMY